MFKTDILMMHWNVCYRMIEQRTTNKKSETSENLISFIYGLTFS